MIKEKKRCEKAPVNGAIHNFQVVNIGLKWWGQIFLRYVAVAEKKEDKYGEKN